MSDFKILIYNIEIDFKSIKYCSILSQRLIICICLQGIMIMNIFLIMFNHKNVWRSNRYIKEYH